MPDTITDETTEKTNAKQQPATYYSRHMFAGLCGYENETILIDADTMKDMAPSMVNKPIFVLHKKVDLENLQAQADGYVTESFYNELDGWLWAKMIIVSDAGHKAIADGYAVSNAYNPLTWGMGGTFHNVSFNRRIAAAKFTSLALVPDPRYESACIFTPDAFKMYQTEKKAQLDELQNSKTNGAKPMFKLWKNKKEEVTQVDEDTMIELENGKTLSVKEMVETILNAKKNSDDKDADDKDKAGEKMNMDQEICVGDEKMPLKELINKYQTMSNKKNEADAEKDAKDKEKENESEDKDKKDKDEKTNAANIDAAVKAALEVAAKKQVDELMNAADKKKKPAMVVETQINKVQRGQATYGSTK